MLSQLEPVAHLFIGPPECPTVDELLTGGDNLPEGVVAKVRFAGARAGTTDEWLFISEIKCPELPFKRLGALRLIAHVSDRSKLGAMGMFLIPIMDKMNGTLLRTDLDLEGVNKLVIRVRCARCAVGTAFRRPCGTTRPSDSSRLIAIPSFVSRWLPPAWRKPRGLLGQYTELRTDPGAYTPACPTDMGFTAVGQLTRRLGRLGGASLSLGSVLHHQTSTGRPLAGRTYSAPLSR
jgi:hypothetical protein